MKLEDYLTTFNSSKLFMGTDLHGIYILTYHWNYINYKTFIHRLGYTYYRYIGEIHENTVR